jgi:hypothetical protein
MTGSPGPGRGWEAGRVIICAMPVWKVRLPPHVRDPYTVFVNGVRQREGADYEVRGRVLVFDRPLVKERKLGLWRWFLGAWGIGTYGKNDQVDVAWEVNGAPRVAHALEIEPPREQAGTRE